MGYKTYTIKIEDSTYLGSHLGAESITNEVESIKKKFDQVSQVELEFIRLLEKADGDFQNLIQQPEYRDYASVLKILTTAKVTISTAFEDFKKRNGYFTLMLMGAVSSGKTSLICDLVSKSPDELTDYFRSDPRFEKGDEIAIDARVATKNLYEFLLEGCHVRLVDVPGIGGVAHDNDTIAPFVDLADAILFIIDANRDITSDDYEFLEDNTSKKCEFLKDHASALNEHLGDDVGGIRNDGRNKRVLVVVNKWSCVAEVLDSQQEEEEFSKHEKWILDGDDNQNFHGIAHLFEKKPEIVTANTRRRLKGKIVAADEKKLEVSELIETIDNLIRTEGINLRTQRPLNVLRYWIVATLNSLNTIAAEKAREAFLQKLENMGKELRHTAHSEFCDCTRIVNDLAAMLANDLSRQTTTILSEWKPSAGFFESFGAAFSDQKKKARTARLEQEAKDLLENNLDYDSLNRLIRTQVENYTRSVESEFRGILRSLPEHTTSGTEITISSHQSPATRNTSGSVQPYLSEAFSSIGNQMLQGLVTQVVVNAVLFVVLSAVLTPLGAILLEWGRRLVGGDPQKKWRTSIKEAVANAKPGMEAEFRVKCGESFQKCREDMLEKALEIIDGAKKQPDVPTQTIRSLREELEALEQKIEKKEFEA